MNEVVCVVGNEEEGGWNNGWEAGKVVPMGE